MPNNFRKTGGYYQSMDGNDGNAGTDPNLPKKTPGDYALGATIIISGDTTASYNFNQRTSVVIPDGVTNLRTTSDFLFGNSGVGSGNKTFGETFGNGGYPIFIYLNGNSFRNQMLGAFPAVFNNIVFDGGVAFEITLGSLTTANECIFKDTVIDITSGSITLDGCQLFNSGNIGNDIAAIKSTYIDSATTIAMSAWFASPATEFINNNCQCLFNVNDVLYELKRDRSGNAIDPNPTALDLIALDANIYTRGNFSEAPLHNNLSKGGYWGVSSLSPNLLTGEGSKNIGGVVQGVTVLATSTEFTTEATVVNLILSTGDYVVDSPATSGSVESGEIQPFPIPQQIGLLLYEALLAFDLDDTPGTGNNQQVPAVVNHAPGTAGANPRRPTVEAKWGQESGVYDNNFYFPADTFATMELFAKPRVDDAGVGTGDPAYNTSSNAPILGKFFVVKVTLRNDIV